MRAVEGDGFGSEKSVLTLGAWTRAGLLPALREAAAATAAVKIQNKERNL